MAQCHEVACEMLATGRQPLYWCGKVAQLPTALNLSTARDEAWSKGHAGHHED